METRKTLQDEVLSWLDEAGNTTTTKTNVLNAIKQAHVQRCSSYDWGFMLWPRAETFNLVVDQQLYSLHQEFDRAFYIKNTTNSEFLRDVPHRNTKTLAPDFNKQEAGLEFSWWSRSIVQNQPTSGSVLTIVSNSASDSGAAKGIVIRGDTADGMATEQINPNGTTAVAGTTAFTQIIQVTKLAAWAGTMTMTSNAGAVTNLKLLSDEFAREYQQIHLLWKPKSADAIEYRFYRRPNPLDYDNSIPDIPDPYKKILVWDALMLVSAYDGTLDQSRVRVWKENQTELETALYAAYGNQTTIAGQSRSVRLLEDIDFA